MRKVRENLSKDKDFNGLFVSIFLNELRHEFENRRIGGEDGILVGILWGVVVFEGGTFLVLEHDARNVLQGEDIMVAVGGELATIEGCKPMVLFIETLHK